VTGIHGYRMRSATLQVHKGPTLEQPSFELELDVVVENPTETLNLRGRVVGELSTSVVVVDCPTERRLTKQMPHPACPPVS
jgi:hypothetical protein